MMPTVRGVTRASTEAGSMVPMSARTSAKTGVAPVQTTACPVAGKV